MKIIITLLLALFISGQAYSNPYRGSDIGLNYGCKFAKEYSTIYKDLDCREVLRQE